MSEGITCDVGIVNRMVMSFLRRHGYFDTLCALQRESGVSESRLGDDLQYLQKLILEGRWDDAMAYLTPLRNSFNSFDRAEFLIRRQQFLEALSWNGAGGHPQFSLAWSPYHDGLGDGTNMESVISILKTLEGKCSTAEFDSLCLCLTLENIRENPDFSQWSVSKGRLDCFELIRQITQNLVPGDNLPPNTYPGLETALALSLTCQYQNMNNNSDIDSGSEMQVMGNIPLIQGKAVLYRGLLQLYHSSPAPNNGISSSTSNYIDPTDSSIHLPQLETFTGRSFTSTPFIYGERSAGVAGNAISSSQNALVSNNAVITASNTIASQQSQENDVTLAIPSSPSRVRHSGGNITGGIGDGSGSGSSIEELRAAASPKIKTRPPVVWTVDFHSNNDKNDADKKNNMPLPLPPQQSTQAQIYADKKENQRQKQIQQQQQFQAKHQQKQIINQAISTNINNSNSNSSSSSSTTVPQVPTYPTELIAEALFEVGCPIRSVCSLDLPNRPFDNNNSSSSSSNEGGSGSVCSMIIGCNDRAIRLLSIDVGGNTNIVNEWRDVHKGSIYTMDTNLNKTLMCSGSNDKCLRICNLRTSTMSPMLKSHTGTVRVVKFHPNDVSSLVSAGAGDNCPRLWDVSTSQVINTFTPHKYAIHGLSWGRSRSGSSSSSSSDNVLFSGCEGGVLMMHDTRSNQIIGDINIIDSNSNSSSSSSGGISCIDISNNMIFASTTNGYVTCIDRRMLGSSSSSNSYIGQERVHVGDVRSVAVVNDYGADSSQSQARILTGSHDGTGGMWLASCDSSGSSDNSSGKFKLSQFAALNGHYDKVLCSIVAPMQMANNREEEQVVLSSGADGRVLLWRL